MENKALSQVNTGNRDYVKSIGFYIEIGIYLVLICNFLILFGNSQRMTLLVSWPTRLMVLYIFVLAIVLFTHHVFSRRVGIIDAWFVALACYTAVCFVLQRNYSQIVQFMCFAMLPACAVLYRRVRSVGRIKRAVYIANIGYALLFAYLSTMPNSHYFDGEYGIKILDELTLGFRNTNEAGIYLMLSFFIMLSSVFAWKRKWQKAFSVILCLVLGYMIWQTRCRIAMVLVASAVVLSLVQRFYKVRRVVRWLVLLLPIVTALATLIFRDRVEVLSFFDEQLDTGRYALYQIFFGRLNGSGILIGGVPGFAGGNLHNSYLSIMALYGSVTMVLYIFFLGAVLREQQHNAKNAKGYVAYVGILCVVAHGIAEGTLLIAGTVYAGLAGLLFLLTLPEETAK